MQKFILNSLKDKSKVGAYLDGLDYSTPKSLIIDDYKKDRNNAQNRLLNKLYTDIGKDPKGSGYAYERGFYKFNYGCPILVRDNEDFADFYDTLLELYEYEKMIEVMSTEIISVSSIMGVKQCSEYIENIYQSAHERDIYLSKPEDLYYEAMGIKR